MAHEEMDITVDSPLKTFTCTKMQIFDKKMGMLI